MRRENLFSGAKVLGIRVLRGSHQISAFQGKPAFEFSFEYQDHDKVRSMSGLAVLKDGNLYMLFYVASQDEFNEELLHRFTDSLQFLEEKTR